MPILTGAQKRRLAASVQKAKRDGKINTAQQTIPIRRCAGTVSVVSERYFTKQVLYDINYQLAQNDD